MLINFSFGKVHRSVYIKVFLLIFLSFVLLFFCIVCVLSFFQLFHESENMESIERVHNIYRYSKLIRNETTSFGIIRSPEQILLNDFKAYGDNDEEQYLISSVGTKDYVCTGSCYCEEEEGTRRTSLSIMRNLKYFVAAISSLSAIWISRSHFENECRSLIGGRSCEMDLVRSTVDDCENIIHVDFKKRLTREQLLEQEKEDKNSIKYLCGGFCLQKDFSKWIEDKRGIVRLSVLEMISESKEVIDCTLLELNDVEIVYTRGEFREIMDDVGESFEADGAEVAIAFSIFLKDLSEFCEENSVWGNLRSIEKIAESYSKFPYEEEIWNLRSGNICVAYDQILTLDAERNVWCERIG